MSHLLKKLLKTNSSDFPALICRLTLVLVILPHGLQKTLGWFGGYGFQGTVGFFTGTLGIPLVVAVLVIAAESLGALAIALGLLTRFCAASMAIVMLGAIFMAHWGNGFFMNWSGQQAGEGFEYHLLVIGLSLALLVSGGGKYSADAKISEGL
jgi:putative oxidoreductase